MSSFSWKLPGEHTTRYSHQEKKKKYSELKGTPFWLSLQSDREDIYPPDLKSCGLPVSELSVPAATKAFRKVFFIMSLICPSHCFISVISEGRDCRGTGMGNQNIARIYPYSFVLEKVFESLNGWNAEAWDVIDVAVSMQICPSYESVLVLT